MFGLSRGTHVMVSEGLPASTVAMTKKENVTLRPHQVIELALPT